MSTIINNFNITVQGSVSAPAVESAAAPASETEKAKAVVTPTTTFNELLSILRSRPEEEKAAVEEQAGKEQEEKLNRLRQELRDAGLELDYEDNLGEGCDITAEQARFERRPGAMKLRNEVECLTKIAVGNGSLEVYVNGYAVYDNGDRKTVLWVPDCGKETYVFAELKDSEKEYMSQREELGLDVLGVLPWFNALVLAGEDQIERHLDHLKTVRTMSDKDISEMEIDADSVIGWVGPAHFDDPETALLKKEAREERRASLTEKQREVYDLYYEEGYTQEEIAEKLGITQQTVLGHLRGLKKKITKSEEGWF